MFLRGLLAVAIVAFGAVVSAPLMLEVRPTSDRAARSAQQPGSTLALAPISLGNPAAAATLTTHNPNLPREAEESGLQTASFNSQTLTVGRGDTLAGLLTEAGVDRGEAQAAIVALGKVFNARRILPGQEITVTFSPTPVGDADAEGTTAERSRLMRMALSLDYARDIAVERSIDEAFTASEVLKPLTRKLARAAGTIRYSLYDDATKAGLPVPVLMELIRAYSWDVDFQRDLRPGDGFEVVYERFHNENGKAVHSGEILFAELILSGTSNPVYRFTGDNGNTEYFDDKGHGARKALMRTPINGARLSSGYGKRKHPILGYTKMHRGVDFAAAPGTPIYAAGDGVIEVAGRNGAYGNYVRIRHNGEYATAYAHMRKFAKASRKGKRVKQGQVIGYVGTTGRSTGPHLHFEILVNGRQTNPMRVKMPSGRKLKGNELARFMDARNVTDEKIAALITDSKLTVANGN